MYATCDPAPIPCGSLPKLAGRGIGRGLVCPNACFTAASIDALSTFPKLVGRGFGRILVCIGPLIAVGSSDMYVVTSLVVSTVDPSKIVNMRIRISSFEVRFG